MSKDPGAAIDVVVVDDSAHNRLTLTRLLESEPDVRVVDRASDGEEGLRKVVQRRPDVVTLDLEMPKLDGYAFLRLLMGTAPTPVIVISSYAHPQEVFKALELSAYDFIAKPTGAAPEDFERLRRELVAKVRAVRLMRPVPAAAPAAARATPAPLPRTPAVIAIGASTGGPPAVQRVLEALAAEPDACLLVAQHMPEHFTRAFAERLDRIGPWSVSEAKDGDLVKPGHAYIAPGGRNMVLVEVRGRLELRCPAPSADDRHNPSVDRLFRSVAEVLGKKALAVVLTGMGNDGTEGARLVAAAGGEVWAESQETAVIFGMPAEAIATGVVRRVLPLGQIGPALAQAARRRRSTP